MTDHITRIRAHVDAHKDRERATFSIEGIKALLAALDDKAPNAATSSPLAEELQWYAAKQRWPKGLEPLGPLLKRAIRALSAQKPAANITLVREQSDHPVPSHGGGAVSVSWTLSINGVVIDRDVDRYLWSTTPGGNEKHGAEPPRGMAAKRDQLIAALSPRDDGLTNEQKETVLLLILDAMGGESDASESKHSWVNWFCSDEIHNVQSDTLNRCMEKGWLRYSHNTDTDHGTIYLSPLGRMRAAQMRATLIAAHPMQEHKAQSLDLNITKEWFEKRAALEGNHEIGAGRRKLTASIDPTPEELAELYRIAHRIPEGWKLVPVEPTEEMEKAGRKEAADCDDTYGSSLFSAAEIYRAMLAAAPAKQEGGE